MAEFKDQYQFIVDENNAKNRLDVFLFNKFKEENLIISRQKIQDIINLNHVTSPSCSKITPSQKTIINQIFNITIPKAKPTHLEPQQIDFDIIYEDQHLLIINKPCNLIVHPGNGNHDKTLVNGLLYRFKNNLSSISGNDRPGIVHRLDKDTNGLMVIAKNDTTHQLLSKMIEQKQVKRHYLAFIYGTIEPKIGIINKNIARCRKNRLKMSVSKINGRSAITHYKTIEVFRDNFASLIECQLETGRTHQIRVHLESIKHSIIGDQTYNSCKKHPNNSLNPNAVDFIKNFNRQALQSYKISFIHPITNKDMSFEIELSQDLKNLCHNLKSL